MGVLGEDDVLDGQVGDATSYVTATLSTQCWQRYITVPGTVPEDNRIGLLFTPEGLNRGQTTPVVLYFHGATGNELQIIQSIGQGANKLLNAWLDMGWAVMSLRAGVTGVVDAVTDDNNCQWGNQDQRDGTIDILDWFNDNFTLPSQGILCCTASAGGTMALNFAMEAKLQSKAVAAVAMVDPAISIRAFHGETTPNGKLRIESAYSMVRPLTVGDSQWVAKVDTADGGHDPCVVDVTQIPEIPIYLSASSNDSTVTKSLHADVLYARLGAAPWAEEVLYIEYTGTHNASAHFRPTDTNAFFERALGLA